MQKQTKNKIDYMRHKLLVNIFTFWKQNYDWLNHITREQNPKFLKNKKCI